jgi:hypothetical protein
MHRLALGGVLALLLWGWPQPSDARRPATRLGASAPHGNVTRVFNWRGVSLGYVVGDGGEWYIGKQPECYIAAGARGYQLYVEQRLVIGAATRTSARRYDVWSTPEYENWPGLPPTSGHRFRGWAKWHAPMRWDVFSRDGRLIAYTRGPDGPAAAVARLLLGSNLRTPEICSR